MSPEEFVATAERLLKAGADESDKRSAISRSYYGAFHFCSNYLPAEFKPKQSDLDGPESHKVVIKAIGLWGKRPGAGRGEAQQIARKLARLKGARKRADCEINSPLNAQDVEYCVEDARELIERAIRARSQYDGQQAAKQA